jgi:hypothetical protein
MKLLNAFLPIDVFAISLFCPSTSGKIFNNISDKSLNEESASACSLAPKTCEKFVICGPIYLYFLLTN